MVARWPRRQCSRYRIEPGRQGSSTCATWTQAERWRSRFSEFEHESRVHLDIETDNIPAEVVRLEKLGARVVDRLERWVVMQAPTGQRFCVVRVQRSDFPKNANQWD